MMNHSSIRGFWVAALLGAAGCAHPLPLEQTPLVQSDVDRFLASGRDARYYGITTYQDAAGPRFEFANRPHPDRSAQLEFVSPKNSPFPVVEVESALTPLFPMLLDSSARQTWATLASVRGLEYRTFAPPTGEYADHVVADVPGYAGVGNKLIFDKLHVESPVYYVPPAGGGLGPLARLPERPDLAPKIRQAREKFARRIPAALGAAAMRNFSFVRFVFPGRAVQFASSRPFKPANASAVAANLPMLDWRGRPAIQAALGGRPILLVIDTAGDFDLALPGERAAGETGTLAFGDVVRDETEIRSHAALGLPGEFPARLGLGVLADYAVTLDFKNRRVWFEDPFRAVAEPPASAAAAESSEPVQYRGVRK